jgi:hypothetical protein
MTEVVALLEACRTSADEAREARARLRTFAETVMKRAAPRTRDRERDPSIFARPAEPGVPHFDPDLDLEDLVMDYRPEPHLEPLPEEKLPPKPPRVARPPQPARFRPAGLSLAVLALVVAGSMLFSGTGSRPMAGPKPGGPGPRVEATNRRGAVGPVMIQASGGPGPTGQVQGPANDRTTPREDAAAGGEAVVGANKSAKDDKNSKGDAKDKMAGKDKGKSDPGANSDPKAKDSGTTPSPSPEKPRRAPLFKK